jgi:hypothetical protein
MASSCATCSRFIGDYLGMAIDTHGHADMVSTDMRRDLAVPQLGAPAKPNPANTTRPAEIGRHRTRADLTYPSLGPAEPPRSLLPLSLDRVARFTNYGAGYGMAGSISGSPEL